MADVPEYAKPVLSYDQIKEKLDEKNLGKIRNDVGNSLDDAFAHKEKKSDKSIMDRLGSDSPMSEKDAHEAANKLLEAIAPILNREKLVNYDGDFKNLDPETKKDIENTLVQVLNKQSKKELVHDLMANRDDPHDYKMQTVGIAKQATNQFYTQRIAARVQDHYVHDDLKAAFHDAMDKDLQKTYDHKMSSNLRKEMDAREAADITGKIANEAFTPKEIKDTYVSSKKFEYSGKK